MAGDALPNAVVFTDDFFRFQAPWMYMHHVENFRPDVLHVTVALLSEHFYLKHLEQHEADVPTARLYAQRKALSDAPMTKEEFQKSQISVIVNHFYSTRPVYFENTVKHTELTPDGYRVIPQGLLYRLVRADGPVPLPALPKVYPFRDVSYVDYSVDKARNNYMTMMYANGIWAEMTKQWPLALSYYTYAQSFYPDPERISSDEEGRALVERKAQVDNALALLQSKLRQPTPLGGPVPSPRIGH